MFFCYQVQIPNDKYDEINAKGWGNTDWDTAYRDLTMGLFKRPPVEKVCQDIIECCDNGLVSHTRTFYTDDLEVAFMVGNGFGDSTLMSTFGRAKSLSVGDIMVDPDNRKAFVCGDVRWIEIPYQTAKEIQAKVDTHVEVA